MLDVRTTIIFVNNGKQDVIHLDPEILITESTRLLLFSIEMGKEEVEGDVFEANEATESVMRDLMDRAVDLV